MSNETSVSLSDLATRINAKHRAFLETMRVGISYALEAGRLLLSAKQECAHGEWGTWLSMNFKGKQRTAQSYMQIAEHWPEIVARGGDEMLSFDAALKLIAVPRTVSAPADGERLDRYTPYAADLIREHIGMPELSPDFEVWAIGDDDDMLEITPSKAHPGYYYVAHYLGCESAHPEVQYTRRPIKAYAIPAWVDSQFKALAGWIRQPYVATDEAPWYVTAPGITNRATPKKREPVLI